MESKKKVAAFVNNHKKELIIGVGAAALGLVIGKKVYGVNPKLPYRFSTDDKRLWNHLTDIGDHDWKFAYNRPFKMADLGKLGEELLEINKNVPDVANIEFTDILAFRRCE